jgi:hypothetical protein
MKFLITNKSLPDNPRLQDFDEAVQLRHFWRSVVIAFFVAMIAVIILQLGINYTFHVSPEYSLPLLRYLAFLFATVLVHELIHIVFLLKHRKELYFVVQPNAAAVGFVVDDFIRRQELLVAIGAPLLILSFVPYAVMMILGHFEMNVFIVVCMNLYMSIGDCVMLRFIAKNSDRHDSIHFENGSLHMRHKAGI